MNRTRGCQEDSKGVAFVALRGKLPNNALLYYIDCFKAVEEDALWMSVIVSRLEVGFLAVNMYFGNWLNLLCDENF